MFQIAHQANAAMQWIATLPYYLCRPLALLKLHKAGLNRHLFLGGVVGSNGRIWPCEGSGFKRISGEWGVGCIDSYS